MAGVPAEAAAAALTLRRVSEEIGSVSHLVSRGVLVLDQLQGAAIASVLGRLRAGLLPAARDLGADVDRAASAVDRYGTRIAGIHARGEGTRDEVRTAVAAIGVSAAALREIATSLGLEPSSVVPERWDAPPLLVLPTVPGSPVGPAAVDALALRASWHGHARRWGACLDRLAAARAEWRRLLDERVEAERELVVDLEGLQVTRRAPRVRRGSAAGQAGAAMAAAGGSTAAIHALLSGRLSPAQVAVEWERRGFTTRLPHGLSVRDLALLASGTGVPFAVQDAAARRLLAHGARDPDAVARALGLTAAGMSVPDVAAQLEALRRAVDAAETLARELPGRPAVQLVGVGTHDGTLTAAVAFGDLQSATHIGINVAGMGSGVASIAGALAGAATLVRAGSRVRPGVTPAVVTWIGYRAPAMPPSVDVLGARRATAGGSEFARFVEGIAASRDRGVPPRRVVVFAHSYGSTMAAEALKISSVRVDAFVTYGSAGVLPGTRTEHLNTDAVFATQAAGDGVASLGVLGSGREDPRELPGVRTFSSDDSARGTPVTVHDMWTPDGDRSLWHPRKTGYLSTGSTAAQDMAALLVGARPQTEDGRWK